MKWLLTARLYIVSASPPRSSVSHEVAQRIARAGGEARHDSGQIVEPTLARQQLVVDRGGEEFKRESETLATAPAPASGRGPGADVRRAQGQPPAVELLAERRRDRRRAVPAELDDRRLEAGEGERRRQACPAAAGMDDEIGIAGRLGGRGEGAAERGSKGAPTGIGVDERDARARQPRRQRCDETADDAGTDDCAAIADERSGIPQRVDRRLHVGGEHRALIRQRIGKRQHGIRGHVVAVLMRMEAEDATADRADRPGLDDANRGVAVFDRRGKFAILEGTAHRLVLARRYLAPEDEAFGAPADAAAESGG